MSCWNVYSTAIRNCHVIFSSLCCLMLRIQLHFRASLNKRPKIDQEWEQNWQHILCMHLPLKRYHLIYRFFLIKKFDPFSCYLLLIINAIKLTIQRVAHAYIFWSYVAVHKNQIRCNWYTFCYKVFKVSFTCEVDSQYYIFLLCLFLFHFMLTLN